MDKALYLRRCVLYSVQIKIKAIRKKRGSSYFLIDYVDIKNLMTREISSLKKTKLRSKYKITVSI
jgi:hypothetical protein